MPLQVEGCRIQTRDYSQVQYHWATTSRPVRTPWCLWISPSSCSLLSAHLRGAVSGGAGGGEAKEAGRDAEGDHLAAGVHLHKHVLQPVAHHNHLARYGGWGNNNSIWSNWNFEDKILATATYSYVEFREDRGRILGENTWQGLFCVTRKQKNTEDKGIENTRIAKNMIFFNL